MNFCELIGWMAEFGVKNGIMQAKTQNCVLSAEPVMEEQMVGGKELQKVVKYKITMKCDLEKSF